MWVVLQVMLGGWMGWLCWWYMKHGRREAPPKLWCLTHGQKPTGWQLRHPKLSRRPACVGLMYCEIVDTGEDA